MMRPRSSSRNSSVDTSDRALGLGVASADPGVTGLGLVRRRGGTVQEYPPHILLGQPPRLILRHAGQSRPPPLSLGQRPPGPPSRGDREDIELSTPGGVPNHAAPFGGGAAAPPPRPPVGAV